MGNLPFEIRLDGYSMEAYDKAVKRIRDWTFMAQERADGSQVVDCFYDGTPESLSKIIGIPIERIKKNF